MMQMRRRLVILNFVKSSISSFTGRIYVRNKLIGFRYLKEYKFGRRGVRVIVNPGKKGEPDVIVGIVRRDRATSFIKSLRNKFETTK